VVVVVVVVEEEEVVQSKGGGKRRNMGFLASKDRAMKRMHSSCDRKEIGDKMQLLVRQRLRESFRPRGWGRGDGRVGQEIAPHCVYTDRAHEFWAWKCVHDYTTGVCMKHSFLLPPHLPLLSFV
jgi:hypothetical protein